jgi:hypothetical protein
MLDTRYTGNVIILTGMTFLAGAIVYVLLSLLFKVPEATYFLSAAKKLILRRTLPPIPPKEEEPITPSN